MAAVPARQFFGTPQTVINTSSNIAAGAFSGAPAAIFDNTSDAAVPYAPKAAATLFINDWAAAPAAGTVIELWGVLQDVGGTSDTDAPSGTASGGARCFGQWVVAGVDAAQRRTMNISLMGVQKVSFYIKNATAQQATNSVVNCTVIVTPFSLGVTA